MKIGYNRRASHTPAYGLLADGWNEVVQDGFAPDQQGVSPVTWDNEVIYAVSDEGDIVGVIAWASAPQSAVYIVTLAYVEPSSRRRGVFKALFRELTARAVKQNVIRIDATVYGDNPRATAAFKRVGGMPAAVTLENDLMLV